MFESCIRDLEKVYNEFERLEKAADELKTVLSFREICSSSFMRKRTRFSSINAFLKAGGFPITDGELEEVDEDALDEYVSANTTFSSWEEMLVAATEDYVRRKLS